MVNKRKIRIKASGKIFKPPVNPRIIKDAPWIPQTIMVSGEKDAVLTLDNIREMIPKHLNMTMNQGNNFIVKIRSAEVYALQATRPMSVQFFDVGTSALLQDAVAWPSINEQPRLGYIWPEHARRPFDTYTNKELKVLAVDVGAGGWWSYLKLFWTVSNPADIRSTLIQYYSPLTNAASHSSFVEV